MAFPESRKTLIPKPWRFAISVALKAQTTPDIDRSSAGFSEGGAGPPTPPEIQNPFG